MQVSTRIASPSLGLMWAVELRAPIRADFAALRALLSSNGWGHRLGDDDWLANLIAASRALIAVEEGQVVGFARAVTDGLSNGYLSMVVVAADHRNRGIGSRLVCAIMGADPHITWVLRLAALMAGLPGWLGAVGIPVAIGYNIRAWRGAELFPISGESAAASRQAGWVVNLLALFSIFWS